MAQALHIHDPFAPEPRRSPTPYPSYGPSQLKTLPQATADWIVRGILARGCVTELTAEIRAGKTTFSAEMVRAMRERRPFLGQPTSWTRVTWLTEERVLTFSQALERAHLDTCDVDEIECVFRQDVAKLTWPALVQHITRAHQQDPGLVIVDTLSRFVGAGPDQENDAAFAARALEPLLGAAKQGLTILCHRHARKGGGDVHSAGRGSSAWSADADVMLLLRKPPRPANGHDDEGLSTPTRTRILEAASRFTETIAQDEPQTILLSPDGYGLVGRDTTQQQRTDDIDEQILLYVSSHPGCPKRDIRSTAAIRGKAAIRDDRVVALVQNGKLREDVVQYHDAANRSQTRTGYFIGPMA